MGRKKKIEKVKIIKQHKRGCLAIRAVQKGKAKCVWASRPFLNWEKGQGIIYYRCNSLSCPAMLRINSRKLMERANLPNGLEILFIL